MKFHGFTAKWFESKGFGFIRRDDGAGADVFVHINSTVDGKPLKRGDVVEFELADDPQGRSRAEKVRRLDRPVRFGETG